MDPRVFGFDTVIVRDGRIVSVSPAGQAKVDAQQVVDAGNRVLLPGLYDMHVHASSWEGGLHLAAGVTSALFTPSPA